MYSSTENKYYIFSNVSEILQLFLRKENIMTWRPEDTALARQQQPKPVLAAMNHHATLKEMLESEHTTIEEL
jgi:hypothetical protein